MTDFAAVERSLVFFRGLGFFTDTALSPTDLTRDLVARYEEEWGAPFDAAHEWQLFFS
jgi:hypothetical protein